MKLSKRISKVNQGGDDGWGVLYRSHEMMDAGIDVIQLTIGEHDKKTAPEILDAMYQSAKAGNTGYALVPGIMKLRRAIAARVQERTGVPTDYRNVVITPGGQSALFAAHMAVTDVGDRALYLDPYYVTYPATLRAVGAVEQAIGTSPENDFQPSRKDLEDAAKGATSLLVNSPNNPTGVVYSKDTIEMICDVARRENLWLISDEVYDTQIWQGEHISPRALPDMAERTIVVGSMSKSHAMTGSRIGWLVAPREVIENVSDLLMTTTYGVSGFIQDAALFALNQGTVLENNISGVFRRRRELAQNVLKGQNAVRLVPSSGAMYIMLDIRATGLDGKQFAFDLLEKHHIAVMPGESFGTSAAGHIRVAMTIEDSIFVSALESLVRFAQSKAKTPN